MTNKVLTSETIGTHGEIVPINEDPTLDIIRRHLPLNYSNVRSFREGGTRKVFLVSWGPKGKTRVIKVDKKPSTPHATRNVDKGYTTAREVQVASGIDESGEHHLTRLYDYVRIPELGKMGFSDVASIEEYFPSQTLEDRVREIGPLSAKEFEQVFRGVLDAERYLIRDQGLLHRDLNRKNILIKQNGELDARVADLTNACSINEVTPKSRPTSGSRFVLDPTTEEVFTGKPSQYSERSEIYAIGKNMLFALTGKDAVAYDPDQRTATNLATGESLLNQDGRLNISEHDRAITSTLLQKLPKKSRQYYYMLRRALSLNDHMRYSSIDELIADFEKASKPTLWERIKKNKGVTAGITAGFLGLSALFGGLAYHQTSKNNDLQAQVEFDKKHQVVTEWSGAPFEAENNLVDLDVSLHDQGDWRGNGFPEKKYLTAKPGSEFYTQVTARAKVRKKNEDYGMSITALPGRIYIEGYDADSFWVWPQPFDETKTYGDMHGYSGGSPNLKIPKDIPPGNYTIAVELYAKQNPSDTENVMENDKVIWFQNPGKIIARKRVPLVVGNARPININYVQLNSINERVDFETLDSNFTPHGVKYEFSIPEEDTTWHPHGYYLWIPERHKRDREDRTLQIVYREDSTDQFLGCVFVPIKRDSVGEDYWKWDYATPGREWSDKLIAYRKALQGDSIGLYEIQKQASMHRAEEAARADSLRIAENIEKNRVPTARGYLKKQFDWDRFQEDRQSRLDSIARSYERP